jgi:maltokinase
VTANDVLTTYGLSNILSALQEYIVQQRWFGGRERTIRNISIDDAAVVHDSDPIMIFTLIKIDYIDYESDIYNIILGIRPTDHHIRETAPRHIITDAIFNDQEMVVYDAVADHQCAHKLWQFIRDSRRFPTVNGEIICYANGVGPIDEDFADVRLLANEQSNTAITRGTEDFLKFMRHIDPGPSVELEMITALTNTGFRHMAQSRGSIQYARHNSDQPSLIALLQEFLHNATDGWALALGSLRDLYADAEEKAAQNETELLEAVRAQGASFTPDAARIGRVTAEMHVALSSPVLQGGLAPHPVTSDIVNSWADDMSRELNLLLNSENPQVIPLREQHPRLLAYINTLRNMENGGLAIRIHGDYHLGQLLRTDAGWTVIDYEGEPARSIAQRRTHSSPLRDIAGMLRSFDYAAAAALAERIPPTNPQWDTLYAYGHIWSQENRRAFWDAYTAYMKDYPHILPKDAQAIVRVFEIYKAIYEASYELGHRPQWASIPLRFLLHETD